MTAFDLGAGTARRALAPLGAQGSDEEIRERHATVVWCLLTEPGDSVARRVIAAFGAAAALEAVLGGSAVPGVTPQELAEGCKRWLPRLSARAVADSVRTASARGVSLVTRADAALRPGTGQAAGHGGTSAARSRSSGWSLSAATTRTACSQ